MEHDRQNFLSFWIRKFIEGIPSKKFGLQKLNHSFIWLIAFFRCLQLFVSENPLAYLTSPYPSFIVLAPSDGSHSLKLYFSSHNCPSPFYPFISKFIPDVEIFEVFCDNITPTKLQMHSGENPRYHIIIYSSWPNIFIYSLEMTKVSEPTPSDLFSDTNHTKLFMEFLSSNMLRKLDTIDTANHTIVSRC